MANGPFNLSKAARHEPQGKVLTIGMTLAKPYSGWCWLYCGNFGCGHKVAVRLQPFADRWGPDTPLDKLCKVAVCKKCGHKGGRTIIPNMGNGTTGAEQFPEDQA